MVQQVQQACAGTQPYNRAEIIWDFMSLKPTSIYVAPVPTIDAFPAMFSDYMVATQMALTPTKLSYLINHGIAPHVQLLNTREMPGLQFTIQQNEISVRYGHFPLEHDMIILDLRCHCC